MSRAVRASTARGISTEIAAPDARRWIERAARLGHVSVGTVYVLVGIIAVLAAIDAHRQPADSVEVFRHLLTDGLGRIVAVALVVGLLADATWQATRALTNSVVRGYGLRALWQRATWLVSGIIHAGIAVAVIRVAAGARDPDGDTAAKTWSSRALALPHGDILIAVVAVIVLAVALVMIYRAWSADVDRSVHWGAMSRGTRRAACALARVGLAARAVTCGIVGGFLLLVALEHNPAEARGVAGAFRTVRYASYSGVAFLGIGFVANGVVELVRARYRRRLGGVPSLG